MRYDQRKIPFLGMTLPALHFDHMVFLRNIPLLEG